MYRAKKTLLISTCLTLVLTTALDTTADIIPAPSIHTLIQEEQDVNVELVIRDDWFGAYSADSYLRIMREDASGSVEVFYEPLFDAEDAISIEPYCQPLWFDEEPEDCQEYPDECEDCDGDGVEDCWGHCRTLHFYEAVDECVPAGEMLYRLYSVFPDGAEDFGYPGTIEVQSIDEECLEEEFSNCSVFQLGASHGGSLLGFLLEIFY